MGGLLKKGAWIVCRFKGGFGKKEGGVFKGVDTSMYTMIKVFCIYIYRLHLLKLNHVYLHMYRQICIICIIFTKCLL